MVVTLALQKWDHREQKRGGSSFLVVYDDDDHKTSQITQHSRLNKGHDDVSRIAKDQQLIIVFLAAQPEMCNFRLVIAFASKNSFKNQKLHHFFFDEIWHLFFAVKEKSQQKKKWVLQKEGAASVANDDGIYGPWSSLQRRLSNPLFFWEIAEVAQEVIKKMLLLLFFFKWQS